MKTATVTEAKNGLSALLDQVKAGESVLITDRGIPVARMEPVFGGEDQDGRVARLERAGLLRRGTAAPPTDLIRTPGPRLPEGMSIVEAVLEERRSGW